MKNEQVKKEPGYYWVHIHGGGLDFWEPARISDDGRIWVIGRDLPWGDPKKYWGVVEFGLKLIPPSTEGSDNDKTCLPL